MRIKEYLELVGTMIEKAENNNNRDECIRLAFLIIDTAKEYIEKVNKSNDSPRTTTNSSEIP